MLHNAAGSGRARLLELGDDELNWVATAEGVRVDNDSTWGRSLNIGVKAYPWPWPAPTCKLKGTMWLSLSEEGVTTTFLMPKTPVGVKITEVDIDRIALLSSAIVDDSDLDRKMLVREVSTLFSATRAPAIIAGETRESIESFVADVAEIRSHDKATGVRPRLIFMASVYNTKDDRAIYMFSGADDCLSKNNIDPRRL